MAIVRPSDRPRWLSILAKADPADLEVALQQLDSPPRFERIIGPEIGLFMTRGRIGGTGELFNLGEITVSRCSVRSSSARIGTGYVLGRNGRHAELVAIFDALIQDEQAPFAEALLDDLERKRKQGIDLKARKVAATRVEFFTMTRGE
jgi:alpha-D-ribose 1-methylphosphonate 5-triphosphate synthase subunit PhnG